MHNGIPVFIEATPTTADSKLRLCQRIIGQLNAMRIAPLHFAASPTEAVHLISALDERNTSPALIVFNSYGLEDHLANLEGYFALTPMLVLQRPLAKPPSGVRGAVQPLAAPRSFWNFGPMNAQDVMHRATQCIAQFLRSGNFSIFEKTPESPDPASRMPAVPVKPLRTQTDSKPFFG